MNKYIKYIELGFSDGLYYRTSNILTFLSGFFVDYVRVAVWYGAITFAVQRISVKMVNDTLLYMILSAAISAAYRIEPTTTLSEAYVKGGLIHRLVYPVSILAGNFCEMLGRAFSSFIINIFPTLLILTWNYRPDWTIIPSRIPIIFLNLIIGLYFNFILFSLIDALCFWLKDTSTLQKLRVIVFKMFSGLLMPLWFLSGALSQISDSLPFSKQIYSPVSYLMGNMINKAYLLDMGNLLFYCIVLSVTVYGLWKMGIRRVESYGG